MCQALYHCQIPAMQTKSLSKLQRLMDGSLICGEDVTHLLEEEEENENENENENDMNMFIVFKQEEDDDKYSETLVSRETSNGSSPSSEILMTTSAPRTDCVGWILRMKACFGFGYQTAYLAVTYFDRFFLRRTIDEEKTWATKLLSVACLSLAAKMEECRPPPLSKYTMEDYQFSSDAIQRMELLVLSTLEWRMSSVTPFAYLGYFSCKFHCGEEPRDLCSRAISFIFAIMKATSLVEYRPSTIAAAAILAATGDQLTKKTVESKTRLISFPESMETEHVLSCYSLMIRDSQKEKLKPSRLLVSSELSASFRSFNRSIDVHNAISFSDSGNKRRRLHLPKERDTGRKV